jgi:hypothetical protein
VLELYPVYLTRADHSAGYLWAIPSKQHGITIGCYLNRNHDYNHTYRNLDRADLPFPTR